MLLEQSYLLFWHTIDWVSTVNLCMWGIWSFGTKYKKAGNEKEIISLFDCYSHWIIRNACFLQTSNSGDPLLIIITCVLDFEEVKESYLWTVFIRVRKIQHKKLIISLFMRVCIFLPIRCLGNLWIFLLKECRVGENWVKGLEGT